MAGQRHAVNVAGWGGLGSIHVAVRVEPEVANLFFIFAEIIGDAGGYTSGDGMVTAENDREKTFT